MPDVEVQDHGSITVLVPLTEDARAWIETHTDPNAQKWGGGIAVEPRYVQAIIDGMEEEGYAVAIS